MTQVGDIMSRKLVVVSPQLSLRDLVELLANEGIGGVPVVTEHRLVGVITLHDVVAFQSSLPPVPRDDPSERDPGEAGPAPELEQGDEADAAYFVDLWPDAGAELPERAAALQGPEWDLLSEHTVEEAMSRRLWTVSPSTTVETAARRMQDLDVHRLLVVEEGQLRGIVTTADVTRAVAEGRV